MDHFPTDAAWRSSDSRFFRSQSESDTFRPRRGREPLEERYNMPLSCELEGASIVLIGSFNPAIFQPEWFARMSLIRASEAADAKIDVIAPPVTSFKLEWVVIQVTTDRFTVSTADMAHLAPLSELVLGTFDILEHTPVKQMGLNRDMHYRAPSLDLWHSIGDRLAPKGDWDGLLESPGMQTIQISGKRSGSSALRLTVTAQPSIRVQPGVYFGTNEHFVNKEESPAAELMRVLKDHWLGAQEYAKTIAEALLRKVADAADS